MSELTNGMRLGAVLVAVSAITHAEKDARVRCELCSVLPRKADWIVRDPSDFLVAASILSAGAYSYLFFGHNKKGINKTA